MNGAGFPGVLTALNRRQMHCNHDSYCWAEELTRHGASK